MSRDGQFAAPRVLKEGASRGVRLAPSSASPVKPINLRVRDEVRALIDQAARAQGRSRSDFMIEAARRAAEDAILDQTVIGVDRESFDRFVALLDAPVEPSEKLRKTMRTRAPWEPQ